MLKKKLIAIIFLVAVILFIGFKSYIYFTFKSVYDTAINSGEEYGKYFVDEAIAIDLPAVSNVTDYNKVTLDFLEVELPYTNLIKTTVLENSIAYTYQAGDNEVMVWPYNFGLYGDDIYNQELVDQWNSKYNLKIKTHKDYYDEMWARDYHIVNAATPIKTTSMYKDLLTNRTLITPLGQIYTFTNDNYSGYIVKSDLIMVHLFDKTGKSVCEFRLMTQDSSEKFDWSTIKNIVGSIKIK